MPGDPSSFQPYAYGRNDPVGHRDPLGTFPVTSVNDAMHALAILDQFLDTFWRGSTSPTLGDIMEVSSPTFTTGDWHPTPGPYYGYALEWTYDRLSGGVSGITAAGYLQDFTTGDELASSHFSVYEPVERDVWLLARGVEVAHAAAADLAVRANRGTGRWHPAFNWDTVHTAGFLKSFLNSPAEKPLFPPSPGEPRYRDPSFGVSMTPVLGPLAQARTDFMNAEFGSAAFNAVIGVADGVQTVVTLGALGAAVAPVRSALVNAGRSIGREMTSQLSTKLEKVAVSALRRDLVETADNRIAQLGANGADIAEYASDSLTSVFENSYKSKAARAFEDAAPGAASDIASGKRIVPGLRFNNPNPRGRNLIRFDGVEGNRLVDRKFNITTKSKQIRDLQRMSEALRQNPAFRGEIQIPNANVKRAALRALEKAGVDNIAVEIVP